MDRKKMLGNMNYFPFWTKKHPNIIYSVFKEPEVTRDQIVEARQIFFVAVNGGDVYLYT